MNLQEFKEALASDATIENEKLKKELKKLRREFSEKEKKLNEQVSLLTEDCEALTQRCWAMGGIPSGSSLCYFCSLRSYHCEHEIDLDQKIKFAKEMEKK